MGGATAPSPRRIIWPICIQPKKSVNIATPANAKQLLTSGREIAKPAEEEEQITNADASVSEMALRGLVLTETSEAIRSRERREV